MRKRRNDDLWKAVLGGLFILAVLACLVFAAWWHFKAPCSTVINYTHQIKDVPTRCLNQHFFRQ